MSEHNDGRCNSIIDRSLRQCREMQLDPNITPQPIPGYTAAPSGLVLERLLNAVLDSPAINAAKALPARILLLDPDCVVISASNRGPEGCGLITPGVSLRENSLGTNAFDLARQYKKTFKVTGREHYLGIFHSLISYAVPVDYRGAMVGLIGFLISQKEDSPTLQAALSTVIGLFTTVLVAQLQNEDYVLHLDLLQEFCHYGQVAAGLIAVDTEARIWGANCSALDILGDTDRGIYGKSLDEVLGRECRASLRAGNLRFNGSDTAGSGHNLEIKATPVKKHRVHLGWILELNVLHEHSQKGIRAPKYDFTYIVGENTELQRCISLARVVANGYSNVLITGESGTGKEVFAQAIHYASSYKDGPFVAINSSAIPAQLMESELFGYAEGAFTGAKKGGLKGKFLQANLGTLFLDEIGDMPIGVQSKLLRVLQDRKVTPLGGNTAVELQIRIISATNQNLQQLIKKGKFRSDLYYRLNVVEITIPPLRERLEDIPALADYFLVKYCGMLGQKLKSIDPEATRALINYSWPGNVRELENVIEGAINIAKGNIIQLQHLPIQVLKGSGSTGSGAVHSDGVVYPLIDTEKQEIIKALEVYGGNIRRAAQALEIGRTTLYRRIKELELLDYIQKMRGNQ